MKRNSSNKPRTKAKAKGEEITTNKSKTTLIRTSSSSLSRSILVFGGMNPTNDRYQRRIPSVRMIIRFESVGVHWISNDRYSFDLNAEKQDD